MKTLVWTIAAAFFVLFVLTTFVPYPPAREPASDYFFKDEIDTGLEYGFQRRLFFWASSAIELGLLYCMSTSLWVRRWAGYLHTRTGSLIVAALGVGLLYVGVHELVHLPLRILRLYHAQAWGMSNLELPGWLQQHAIVVAVYIVTGAIVVFGLYFLLSMFPRTWWLIAPVGASAFAMAYALLAPILINPLFNDFTPLGWTKWSDQEPGVQALIDKAGIPVQEILVMNASRQSNHTNAYFAGFGPTRRIVLYDTLLKNHTPDEIESVLAHEIGHWQHDHITKGILLGTLAAVFGCFLLDRLLRAAVGRAPWNLQSPADPAGLPLILLLINLGGWVAMPLENAVSRHFERQADQAALELAQRPDAFSACEQKMARDNKSNVAPTPWNVWLFSSHPTTVERIHTAEEWKKE
jgi:STE24 endopeptidase